MIGVIKGVLGFRVAQTPRFPQTPEIQVSVMFVPHMTGSC